jgi:hypothetical protein
LLPSKYRPLTLFSVAVLGWTCVWGCAQTNVRLGEETDDAGSPAPGFTPPSGADAGDAGIVVPPELLLCIGTECPAPFATCAPAKGPAYKCGIDLSSDPKNCGACGNECLVYKPIHMTSRCVDGACELECMNDPSYPTDRRNCNGEIDDGCEIDVLVDAENCGACGNACGAGQPCIKGKCGCAAGQIVCNGVCVNADIDDMNCGGCGNECQPPAGACDPMPPRAYHGCVGGTCGHLKCGGASADCNNDLGPGQCSSDGCEVEDLRTDRNNCGGCGVKCLPDQECINEGFGFECAVPCSRFGKILCPSTNECVDLLTNANHCGGCGNFCPNAGPNQIRGCDKGLCKYECTPGFADCNGNPADGCEVNLRAHPGNCGACGNRCDIAAGQPCVEGKCLMRVCDDEETK